MADERRLQDKLRSFASDEADSGRDGRPLAPLENGGHMGAVLREIDETILARELSFTTDAGLTMVVLAANRRLMTVKHMPDRVLSDIGDALTGVRLNEEDEAVKTVLRDAMEKTLADAQSVRVKSRRAQQVADASEIGLSAAGLAVKWGYDIYPLAPPDLARTLTRFLDEAQKIADCLVVERGGDGSDRHADNARSATLQERLTADLGASIDLLDKCFEGNGGAPYLAQTPESMDGATLFLLSGPQLRGAILVPPENRHRLLSCWNELAASPGAG